MSESDQAFWDATKFVIDDFMSSDDERMYQEMKRLEAEQEEGSSTSRTKQKRQYIERGRDEGHARLYQDYFASTPVFDATYFRRRFRMSRQLFNRILEGISNHSEYFTQRYDGLGKKGLSPLQKCTAAMRQLAYGTAADQSDEYIRIGEKTAIDCLHNFCQCLIDVFSNEYLRKTNKNDIERLTHKHSVKHGFPGMLGSIDCMHWAWKTCPVAWKGQYTRGDHGYPTIMLEAVASQDLWIWHAYFGVAGSNNDIHVLNQSTLFNDVLQGTSPVCEFIVNGRTYTKGYYLADGIYPEWATLVKSIPHPIEPKIKKFKEKQESARKDVERAFGVLQSRWAIVRGPTRAWSMKKISNIMYACIIMHNMIVEDEGYAISNWSDETEDPPIDVSRGAPDEFEKYLKRYAEVHDRITHYTLRADLVEHIWEHIHG